MNSVTQRETMFLARLDATREVRDFLEFFCLDADIQRSTGLRLNLVLEELFTNTVKHGHRGDCDSPVWIGLEANDNTVTLTYLDQAPPFNPLAMTEHCHLDTALEHRKEGGLGVLLATELAIASEYLYLYGRNRLRMVLAR